MTFASSGVELFPERRRGEILPEPLQALVTPE
jgi:hypothetical protein